jgi:hypothetical protein
LGSGGGVFFFLNTAFALVLTACSATNRYVIEPVKMF